MKIREMTKECNRRFSEVAAKVILSFGLFVFLSLSCYFLSVLVSVFCTGIFSEVTAVCISFVLLFFIYALIFVFHYGFMILMLRLVRRSSVSLGYLFLGFKQKRISGAVRIFTVLLFFCVLVSSIPILMNIDITSLDSLRGLFSDKTKFAAVSLVVTLVFFASFLIFFLPGVFAWEIIYDSENETGFKAIAKSWRMLRSNFFRFILFELSVGKGCILILLAVEILNAIFLFVLKKNPGFLFAYAAHLLSFATAVTLFSKISFSIPFFYETISEKKGSEFSLPEVQ